MVTRPARSGDPATIPGSAGSHILVIESRYYNDVADALIAGASAEFEAQGTTWERVEVAGALEIPQALALAVDAGLVPRSADRAKFDGVIVIGCVIRGETSHYDIVVGNANHWLMQTAIAHRVPLGNAILTVDTAAQAMARAEGGRRGKGGDAARACLGLIALAQSFSGPKP